MLSTLACFRGSQKGIKVINQFSNVIRFTNISKQSKRGFKFFTPTYGPARGRFNRGRMDNKDSEQVFDMGRVLVAAGASLSVGLLCVYGLSQTANSTYFGHNSDFWPEYVRERIRHTYLYVTGSAVIAAGTAALMFRSPAVVQTVMRGGFAFPIGMFLTTVASSIVCKSLPYPQNNTISAKHLAWALFSMSVGASIMPVCVIGGEILTQAALYSGAIVGALSLVAASAPSDQFLNWGGPLAVGLGVVVVSSLGSIFVSNSSRLGSGLAFISLYGGLFVFSGLLLYNTQNLIHRAKLDPPPNYGRDLMFSNNNPNLFNNYLVFDPINQSMNLFLDSVNIFVRMVFILMDKKKK